MNSKSWISAARPRTLPLALSVILMGGFIAASNGCFRWDIFLWSIATTLCLQVLSNFANDFGDTQHGADNALRQGPQRAVQSGEITRGQMLAAMGLFVALSLISGLILLYVSFGSLDWKFLVFLALGIVCIAAAINYTAGKNPYGYAGLGDVSVFIFFGIVGVGGSAYLYNLVFDPFTLLPAYTCGVFSVAVLNLNNMRDILPDTMAGKRTIPARIGYEKAKYYQLFLILTGVLTAIVYHISTQGYSKVMFFLLVLVIFIRDLRYLFTTHASDKIDHLLKRMALGTLLFVILFGIGIIL